MIVILPTAEEAAAIRQGDRELINRYYMANREYIERVAKNYCRRVANFKDWEDLAQEAYLHFAGFELDTPAHFGHCLYKCFALYRWGGQRKYGQAKSKHAVEVLTILDSTVKDAETPCTLCDTIPSDFDIYEELEPRPDITDGLYNFLGSYLAPEQKKVFTYLYYTGMTQREIAKATGKAQKTVKRTREVCFRKFRAHADELRGWLERVGYLDAA